MWTSSSTERNDSIAGSMKTTEKGLETLLGPPKGMKGSSMEEAKEMREDNGDRRRTNAKTYIYQTP